MLRPYQQEAVDNALEAIRAGTPSIINACVASGKSHMIAGICQHLDNALILAPSKELVVQNRSKLEQAFKEVAPDKVSELGIYSAGLGKRELKPYTFATVNSVYKLGDKLKMFDTVLLDECFFAGTLVDGRPIESIGVGDSVLSYNHKTGKAEKRKVVRVIKKQSPDRMICIRYGNRIIISTPNHEFYTQRGYVRADKLKEGDSVYEVFLVRERDNGEGISRDVKAQTVEIQKDRGGLLQLPMQSEGSERKDKASSPSESRTRVLEGSSCEGLGHEKEEWYRQADLGERSLKGVSQGRERKTANHPAEDSTRETWSGLDGRAADSNARAEGEWQVSNMLQSGFGQPMANAGNRAGWERPQESISKEEGHQEDYQIKPTRVDGITVFEQKDYGKLGLSDGGDYVYCISVEENHNFFANQVLVHNCHLFNPRKGMYRQVIDTIGTNRVIGLTGTPYRFEHQVKYGPQGVATRSVLRTLTTQGFFKQMITNISMGDMIDAGYLTPIEYYKDSVGQAYTKSLRMNSQGTDYTEESLSYYGEQTAKHIAQKANRAIETGFCKKVLVFAVNIAIAERIAELAHCHCITGETKAKDRDKWLQEYKDASTGVMVNVATLTTGVDIPSVDCIILARPTKSPGLYTQIVGRSVRLDPSNPDKVCKLIDETNTVEHLGKVEAMYIRDNQLYSAGRRLTDTPGRTIVIKRRKHGMAR